LFATAAAIALSAVVPACATTEPGRPLGEVFPDPALAACVAVAAGLPDATGDAADADLDAIEQLHCDGGASAPEVIRSLDGVEELTSLSVLDVPRNQITDLAPVASLAHSATSTRSGCRATTSSTRPAGDDLDAADPGRLRQPDRRRETGWPAPHCSRSCSWGPTRSPT
jgi:hypothetical protein